LYHKARRLIRARGRELGLKYELKETSHVPEWAQNEPEPRFRFVQLTDIHWTSGLNKLFVYTLRYISRTIQPAFVVITGDNTGSSDLARQRVFKRQLDSCLRVPYFIQRGDNWPKGFTEVFGSSNWSFCCGGVAFVGAAIDRDIPNLGIGTFDEDTFQWILGRFDAHRDKPVIYFQHVNVMPPTFLDAPRLRREMESRTNVVATVTGHLHRDYETRVGHILHLVGPAFGPHEEHPFKVFNVYADHITVRTVKYRNGHQFVRLYQRIDFPQDLRLRDAGGPTQPAITDYQAPPPREVVFDNSLAERMLELVPPLMASIQYTGRAQEIYADIGELLAEINKAAVK